MTPEHDVFCCPNCGFRPGAADFAAGLSRRGLTVRERDMLERLVAARGAPVTRDRLIDALYGDDPDGGPLSAGSNIYIYVGRLDSKLIERGFRVVNAGYGLGWCLRPLAGHAAGTPDTRGARADAGGAVA